MNLQSVFLACYSSQNTSWGSLISAEGGFSIYENLFNFDSTSVRDPMKKVCMVSGVELPSFRATTIPEIVSVKKRSSVLEGFVDPLII